MKKINSGVIKIIYTLPLFGCLISCGYYLPTNKVLKDPYIVISFESYGDNMCKYNLETGMDYIDFQDNISVIDSIGKFMIGDSLRLSLNKQ